MPAFVSQAQVRKFGALVRQGKITQHEFEKRLAETGDISRLPEHVGIENARNRRAALGRLKKRLKGGRR